MGFFSIFLFSKAYRPWTLYPTYLSPGCRHPSTFIKFINNNKNSCKEVYLQGISALVLSLQSSVIPDTVTSPSNKPFMFCSTVICWSPHGFTSACVPVRSWRICHPIVQKNKHMLKEQDYGKWEPCRVLKWMAILVARTLSVV